MCFRGKYTLKKGEVEVMSPKKRLHTMKKKSEKGNEARGSGLQSRIGLGLSTSYSLGNCSRSFHSRQSVFSPRKTP